MDVFGLFNRTMATANWEVPSIRGQKGGRKFILRTKKLIVRYLKFFFTNGAIACGDESVGQEEPSRLAVEQDVEKQLCGANPN